MYAQLLPVSAGDPNSGSHVCAARTSQKSVLTTLSAGTTSGSPGTSNTQDGIVHIRL